MMRHATSQGPSPIIRNITKENEVGAISVVPGTGTSAQTCRRRKKEIIEENEDRTSSDTNGSFSTHTSSFIEENNVIVPVTDFNLYRPLYKAALTGDLRAAQKFMEQNDDVNITSVKILSNSDTVMHVAVDTGISNDFVRILLRWYQDNPFDLKNADGDTALHRAATVGNMEAVGMLVDRNPKLQYILNKSNRLPVHVAAIFSHKDVLTYLLSKSREDWNKSPFVQQLGIRLLLAVIASGFFDVALSLVETYPVLATLCSENGNSALEEMAKTNSAFPSGECFSWLQKFIYSRIPLRSPIPEISVGDIENVSSNTQANHKFGWFRIMHRGSQKLDLILWNVLEKLVPYFKSIKEKKIRHQQAHELVKRLCKILESSPYVEASLICKRSIVVAANYGIDEVIEVIIETFPETIYTKDQSDRNIFHLAANNRLENVFNLIYQMSDRQNCFYDSVDSDDNNFMHLCAGRPPPHRLNLVPGAALQMQRELQWFKQMENFVAPSRRVWVNKNKLTPQMLFTMEHEELKTQGEKWMKDTATSCTIAAALICTVVYAAAFTIPGGTETGTGVAILRHRVPFILFAISDTVSLFASVTSLLMFLSILTSRYAEEDFLYVLPRRLCIGLLALFVSIVSMMIAFGATLYLVFWREVGQLFLIPIGMLACMPMASFILLQSPLLVDVMSSTFGKGIFGKKSDTSLY